ncbi:hypothetical protein AVEN_11286-1 [Araneus ventricosus]|uniref:Integrase catalytic domain-containing protein n=1 Tax=Araneus ventricosus TaxID=182803 RepID=A0A4Y2IX39_ARAVE|nr:hypothetical protein AVEN_11286-1 [Araneus ventricosus]
MSGLPKSSSVFPPPFREIRSCSPGSSTTSSAFRQMRIPTHLYQGLLPACTDRFTRWPEAVPISDISTEAVVRAFICQCLPSIITKDQGRQLESNLFSLLSKLLGVQKIRSTPYHPSSKWNCRALSSTFKAKPRMSHIHEMHRINSSGFVLVIKGGSTIHISRISLCFGDLHTCAFVRHDAVKKPLQAPYNGPYCVLRRTETIEKNGKETTINIDRAKPAFFENSHQSSAPTISSPLVAVPSSMQSVPELSPSSPVSPPNSTPPPYVTRSCRRAHFNPR